MDIEALIQDKVAEATKTLYGGDVKSENIQIQQTKKEFEGDKTVVVFPLLKLSKKKPEATAEEIGNYLTSNIDIITGFNVIQGFLNLTIDREYWIKKLNSIAIDNSYGFTPVTDKSEVVMVEYSSPNTNKPLHLGHIRNNLLGHSISEIMKANGYKVVKTNIVNDRGIHICKSMYAWQKEGNGETPESSGIKGDHLVGKYYVKFDQILKNEINNLVENETEKEKAVENTPSMKAVREMLLKWEAGDPDTKKLWKTMNNWVYAGFDKTYKKLGVSFDKIYYESDTYLAGKSEVLKGVDKGIFYQHNDGSVWANLKKEKLDEKILLRSNGTSVYITQDIGTARMRFEDYPIDHMIYVVGNEQNYHFQALSVILDKLGYKWARDLYHFSYGMVELPHGKMKSREGTTVDADDLIEEMYTIARKISEKLGKLDGYKKEEKENTHKVVAMGALKYFILKVDPKKNMLFNPEESIDFNGNTGPFIQYTYARIQSVLRKAIEKNITIPQAAPVIETGKKETELIKQLERFPAVVKEAGSSHSPALVANYIYELVKEFNQFYHDHSIASEPDKLKRELRLVLTTSVGKTIKSGFSLLGIKVPERM